jgi:hypothetical protein
MTLISKIFENIYKYLTKSQLIIAFLIYLEFLSIFIELCIAIHKINGKYVFGLGFGNLKNNSQEVSMFYYILYISPYFYVKNINICSYSAHYCYTSYTLFGVTFGCFLLLSLLIIISSYENKISALNTENSICLSYVLKFSYNVIDFGFFKVFGMALLYIITNQLVSGVVLISYGLDIALNSFMIIISFVSLVVFLAINFYYISWFNLYVQVNNFFAYDYMLSKKYDLFILLLKIFISTENNILAATGMLSQHILIFNYFIIGFSFAFVISVLYSIINKNVLFINNQNLNKFRLFMLIYTNLSCLYLLVFFEDLITKNVLLNTIVSLVLILVAFAVVGFISNMNNTNLLDSNNLIDLFLHLLNLKLTDDAKSLEQITYKNIFFVGTKNIEKRVIDNNIYQIYILHANKCKEKECKICKIDEFNFGILAAALREEINRKAKKGHFESGYTPEQVECFKLAEFVYFSKNINSNKLIKLIFHLNVALQRNRNNFGLFNNLSILKSYLMNDNNKEKMKRGFLLHTYDSSKTLAQVSIETVINFINCSSLCSQEEMDIAIIKLNKHKQELEQNINLLEKHKNFFHLEYDFILLRVIFQSLFNCNIFNEYNIFNIEGLDDRLELLFKDKRCFLKYSNTTKRLEIMGGAHDFENYNGMRFHNICPKYICKTQQKEFIKVIKSGGLEISKFAQIIEKDSFIQVIELGKAGALNIYPSLNQNELYIDFFYKLKSTGLILIEHKRDSMESLQSNVLDLNIINYSEDMFKFLFLEIPWIEYFNFVSKKRNLLTIKNIFTILKGNSERDSEIVIELDYMKYSELYLSIIQELCEASEDTVLDSRVKKYLTEIDYLKFNKGKHVFRLCVAKKLQSDNGSVYTLYNIERNQEKKQKSSVEDNARDFEYCYTEENTLTSSVNSSSKYIDSINTKNIKKSIIDNGSNLRMYTFATLALTLFLIFYSTAFMILGVNSNIRFQFLTNTRVLFSRLRYRFSSLSLTLFYSTKIAGINYDNQYAGIDSSIYSELDYKIEDFNYFYDDFKRQIYQYKAYNDLTYIYDKSYNYENIIPGSGNKLQRRPKQITFLEMVSMFINNCKIIQLGLDEHDSEIYIVNVTKTELTLPLGVEAGHLKPHIFILYQMMKNTDEYLTMFNNVKDIIDSEHTDNLNRVFFYNLYLSTILIVFHTFLVILCKAIIKVIEGIVVKDIVLIEEILNSADLKFLKIKLISLKRLARLYNEKPSCIIEDLKKDYKDYVSHTKLEVHSIKPKIAPSLNSIETGKSVLIRPVNKSYKIIFFCYFAYAIIFFWIFYSFFDKVEQTRDYLFTNSKLFETIYTGGILTKYRILQNFTSKGTETSIKALANEFFTFVKVNKKAIQKSPIIKEAYDTYENKLTNCTTYLSFLNDSLIYNITQNDQNKLKLISDFCEGTELMDESFDKIYGNLGHTFFELYSNYGEMTDNSKLAEYFKEDNELDRFIFLVFRPLQYFITSVINVGSLNTVSQAYMNVMIIFLASNILTEILLFYLLNRCIIKQSAQVSLYYNTLINCLSIM